MAYYPLLIFLLPFAAALLTAVPSSLVGEKNYRLGALAHAVAFSIALLVLFQSAVPDFTETHLILFASPWSALPSIDLSTDRLAAVMMVVISGIGFGTLLYLYSIRYMQQDRDRARYQTLSSTDAFSR